MSLPTHQLEDAHLLRIARAIMDYTQQDLSNLIGVTKSYVCKMEQGRRPLNDKAKGFVSTALKWFIASEAFRT